MPKTPKSKAYDFKNPNWVLKGKGFFVSFIRQTEAMNMQHEYPVLSLAAAIVANGEAIDGECETALVKGSIYRILNGDWTAEYEKLIPKGFAACKEFFEAHLEHKSSWSTV